MGHLYMQWIELMVLCMVSSVWDIKSYLKRPQLYANFNKLQMEDEYRPAYENTLPGITNIATPMAKSTPVTQASQTPVLTNIPLPERDMVEPVSSERARTAYLE